MKTKRDLEAALKNRMNTPSAGFETVTFNKLFGATPGAVESPTVSLMELPLDKLVTFFTYKIGFRLLEGKALELFADELMEDGLLEPIKVRPIPNSDCFEILCGHNRVAAYRLKRRTTIRAEVLIGCSDVRALNIATATNLQRRSDYNPIELGTAWRALVEVKAHQGYRSDLKRTSVHNETESAAAFGTAGAPMTTSVQNEVPSVGEQARVAEEDLEQARVEVANAYGISPTTVWRYIRLTYLIPELVRLVEKKKLAVVAGTLISEYDQPTQVEFFALWRDQGKLPQEAVMAIKDKCPTPTIVPLTLKNSYQNAMEQLADKAKGRTITFRRKPFESYLTKLGGEKQLEDLFLQFLKERVG